MQEKVEAEVQRKNATWPFLPGMRLFHSPGDPCENPSIVVDGIMRKFSITLFLRNYA